MRPEDQTVGAEEPDVEQAAVEIRFLDAVGEEAETEEETKIPLVFPYISCSLTRWISG